MAPFAYDEQIASQPDAIADALAADVPTLDSDRPVVFTGTGTSFHACQIAGYWTAELSEGRIRPLIAEAHEFALRGQMRPGDQIVIVSHRGTKRFPTEIIQRAAAAGAHTVMVTGRGADHLAADVVLRTCADERASTHTVSYTTALAVLGRLVARLTAGEAAGRFDAALTRIPGAVAQTLASPIAADVLTQLSGREPVYLIGFGIDAITMSEGALKFKEGTYRAAEGMSVELALHGTPAAFEPRNAVILAVPAVDDGGRTESLSHLLQMIGVPTVLMGSAGQTLSFAPVDYLMRPFVSVVPLQRVVAELARRYGSNPDTTRADVEPYRSAIRAVEL